MLQADNDNIRQAWIDALQAGISSAYNVSSSLSREQIQVMCVDGVMRGVCLHVDGVCGFVCGLGMGMCM